jgi:hypothetical protein
VRIVKLGDHRDAHLRRGLDVAPDLDCDKGLPRLIPIPDRDRARGLGEGPAGVVAHQAEHLAHLVGLGAGPLHNLAAGGGRSQRSERPAPRVRGAEGLERGGGARLDKVRNAQREKESLLGAQPPRFRKKPRAVRNEGVGWDCIKNVPVGGELKKKKLKKEKKEKN